MTPVLRKDIRQQLYLHQEGEEEEEEEEETQSLYCI